MEVWISDCSWKSFFESVGKRSGGDHTLARNGKKEQTQTREVMR